VATTVPEEQVAPVVAGRARRRIVDAVLLAAVVALLAFPVLARLAASRLPIAPTAVLAVISPGARGAPLRDLPAGLRPGPAPRRLEDVRPAAVALLGERTAVRLLAFVSAQTFDAPTGEGKPYRYPQLDRILPPAFGPAQVEAATDLGARLALLGDVRDPFDTRNVGAGAAAYALLDRARGGGACAPSLDVLLLVASDLNADESIVAAEAQRAAAACPRDPTPGWLLGEFQSLTGYNARAFVTFRRVTREFPGSAAAWSGEADANVRFAAVQESSRAFVVRHRFERALAGYRRAVALQPDPELQSGVAIALAGLGRAREAAALQRRVVAAVPQSDLMRARLVDFLERAHAFAAEARVAGDPAAPPRRAPSRPARFPHIARGDESVYPELLGLISVGADRLEPLRVRLFPTPQQVPAFTGAPVVDTSFIPAYRPGSELTRAGEWCLRGARSRALLLAGSPAAALEVPAGCGDRGEPDELAAIAQLELGDRRGAQATLARLAATNGTRTQEPDDLRQNLWRWAGDLARASQAVREWMRAPHDDLAFQRRGEIEYLRRDFDAAAGDFGAAARRARDRAGGWNDVREARATLDRGAALAAAGRSAEAMVALRAADDVASRAMALRPDPDDSVGVQLARVSGYARFQLADAERHAGALRAAADDYDAARERRLPATSGGALENNAAVVDIGLGRAEDALHVTRAARDVDPESPAYLMTGTSAAERDGHPVLAIELAGAALAADPSTFSAANDLGVLLASRGDEQRAVAALRRAVGANRRYALGWFNLGVVLSRMGPRHLFASQGALARAFALDPALRDRERVPTADERTYRLGLDVSRPLPARWSFASDQREAPVKTAGLAALLLVVFTLSRALTTSGSGRQLAETWLGTVDRFGGRFLRRFRHPAIAIAATLAVFAWPLARDPGGGVWATLAGLLALVVLVAVALRARASSAQATWAPGVVVGAGAAAAGLTWAPLPVLGEKASARRHWAAPLALAAVALPLVALAAWSDVPLARSTAAAALVMASSLLTPVKPIDGGAIAAAGATAAGLSGIALAVLLALGLL
jgi:tetratricopeptide (TPR) repeat protein